VGELAQDGGGALAETDLTSTIARIWSEVLGLGNVDPQSDFFELGGDSLAAVRMLFAVEDQTSVQVSFADFLEGPTVGALADLVVGGRSDSPGALGSLGSSGSSGISDSPGPHEVADTPDGDDRLSFAQERLWFLEQLGGSTAAYNMPIGARLRGALDVDALRRALGEVVSRHEALRTTFASEGRHPGARVAPSVALDLEQIDLRGQADSEGEARRMLAELASRPFDLARGPLLRAALVQLADEEQVLELVFHHIVCDGRSHVVIMDELAALYEACRAGEPSPLGEPDVQYGRFATAQRATLDAQGMERLVAPWLERLRGAPQALDLPSDRPRPVVPGNAGATYRVRLPNSMTSAVRGFAREMKATPYTTLLSAFYVLLFRHSGQQDIVIGATTAGRERPELQDGVGLFANTVALRSDMSGDPSFQELVARVRETVLWAIAHERAPLQEIVARSGLERDLGRHPLFQVFCAQVPLAPLAIDGAEPYDVSPTTSRFDLTLFVEEEPGDELELAWEYSTDLFDAATIERLAARYLRILEHALADPTRSIEALPLLDAQEREQAIAAGRESGREYPVWCVHEAFERRAAAAPDDVAVSFEEQSLTYGQLNERANRLAHRLIDLGAGPEALVALFFEPSLEMVVGILGVLKAGAAYLPLDPEHPRERLDFVIGDAQAKLIVTEQRLLERLGEIDAPAVCLDRDAPELERQSPANPVTAVAPENLAYVIYTSGSTGRPKGVLVEHRQVARLFTATEQWFAFGPRDVWVLLHSYAFDFSVWELWGALAHGGQLVISPVWTTRSPQALAGLVASRGVTVLNATPSLFAAIQDELLRIACDLALRVVVFGGEALRPATLRPWFEHHGDDGPALVNMYGITETTVHVTHRPLRAVDCEREASPVGVPIPDLSVQVLDARGTPVPAGVAGELYVGGAGVARGYLNRPELTAERFIENPFGSGRLYRTGDVAARTADGQLEFRGRADDQVKIRGFRIELGEIESTLREHPSVSDCAAVAVEAAPGDMRLAAYVVARAANNGAGRSGDGAHDHGDVAGAHDHGDVADDDGYSADGEARLREELIGHMEQRLPSYMVPAALTLLERIPLTRNGKTDRRALPTPTWEHQDVGGFAPPETPTEATVAEVWQGVLAVERVGVEDNFFNLGGHSLLAARVVTQVRRRCQVEISVRALFEHPTLREFASAVDAGRAAGEAAHADGDAGVTGDAGVVGDAGVAGDMGVAGDEAGATGAQAPASPSAGTVEELPLSFPQQQLLFFDQLTPGSVTYNAALAWRVNGPLDMDALQGVMAEVFGRQQALRTVFTWDEREVPRQALLEQWDAELPLVDLSGLAAERREAELARLLTEHALRPFDLAVEPMLRTTVFRLAPDEHVILFAPHHIAFDAWAVEVLYREVGELYAARLQGRDADLPELALQYRDFAVWQRDRLRGALLDRELDFWRTQLAGAPTVTRLPADRPRGAEQSFEGATHRFSLDAGLANAVRELCAQTGVTPYMLLLAAFGTLLYRSSGQDDILVGGPMANRQLPGIEHLIGFFANTVVVRVRLGGNPTFSELLTRVRDSVLTSYEHQEAPLELVVEAVRPERDPAINPLFQVNFRVRVGESPQLELAGARTQSVPVEMGLARFELSLELHLLEERIEAELSYNVALFDQGTVERLALDFESLLRTVLAQPEIRLLGVQLPSEQAVHGGEGALAGGPAIGRFRRAARGPRRGGPPDEC
jgi:amino acid adenylation domain-containing protein